MTEKDIRKLIRSEVRDAVAIELYKEGGVLDMTRQTAIAALVQMGLGFDDALAKKPN